MDDSTLSFAHEDPCSHQTHLEHTASEAIQWFNENHMLANPDKFQAIVLCPSPRDTCNINFDVAGNCISSQDHVSLLGVELDNKLKFNLHISNLCRKAARQLNVLKSFSRVLDTAAKMCIFRSFILSSFSYCPLVWHFCGKNWPIQMEKNTRTWT